MELGYVVLDDWEKGTLNMVRRCVGSARRWTSVAAILAAAFVTWGQAPSGAVAHVSQLSYKNPVYSKVFPDPMILRTSAHDYYAYSTQTAWEHHAIFPVLHSSDLVHWKYVGDLFKKEPSWSTGDNWAPTVVKSGKTYYAYFTGLFLSLHCVGVATSSSPTGGFKSKRKIGCAGDTGNGYIDPDLFIDKDGKAYLYVSVDSPAHNISVIPMKKDLIHPAGKVQQVLGVTQDWEKGEKRSTVEGPFVIRQGNTYFLFFSGNDWEDNYGMGYATSTSPMGPFTAYSGNPIVKGNSHVFGPGGGSIVQGTAGTLWLAYHAWPGATGRSSDKRNLRIDPLTWNGTSFSVTVTPS